MKSPFNRDLLLSELSYDPDSGEFRWRRDVSTRVKAGMIAGTITRYGYRSIKACGWPYRAHRLAWVYVYGDWPNGMIDHIDGNRLNNAICNLREVTNQQNQANAKRGRGYCVIYECGRKRYRAGMTFNGKSVYLGHFDSAEEASAAYRAAHLERFGEFSSLSRGSSVERTFERSSTTKLRVAASSEIQVASSSSVSSE